MKQKKLFGMVFLFILVLAYSPYSPAMAYQPASGFLHRPHQNDDQNKKNDQNHHSDQEKHDNKDHQDQNHTQQHNDDQDKNKKNDQHHHDDQDKQDHKDQHNDQDNQQQNEKRNKHTWGEQHHDSDQDKKDNKDHHNDQNNDHNKNDHHDQGHDSDQDNRDDRDHRHDQDDHRQHNDNHQSHHDSHHEQDNNRGRRHEHNSWWDHDRDEHGKSSVIFGWSIINGIKERSDARHTLQRTAAILDQAQRLARRDTELYRYVVRHGDQPGLGRAFSHQLQAKELFHDGHYQEATFHSLRARVIALRLIGAMQDESDMGDRGEYVLHDEDFEITQSNLDDLEVEYWERCPSESQLSFGLNDISDDDALSVHIELNL